MKSSGNKAVTLLILTYTIVNVIMAKTWYEVTGLNSLSAKYLTHLVLFSSHIICVIFMLLSILFFRKHWAYIVNIVFLLSAICSEFVLTFVMCFIVGPFGFIIPILGAINLRVFFCEPMREYFGFKTKDKK